ncbi:MAG TPA: DUF5686 family protein, partial [Puia sp.]|nr:DUF5686 family protein [Puia sp.]
MFAGTKNSLFLLIVCFLCHVCIGQTRGITGTVMDSVTHQPIANASISTPNGHRGVLTDSAGHFHLNTDKDVPKLVISAAGYQSISISTRDQLIVIYLSKKYTLLKEFVVKRRPGRYRNKNNPAVELIRKVIANKARNGPGADAYTSYHEYEKTRLLLDNVPKILIDNFLIKKYHFLFDNRDTTIVPGKSLIPVYIEEVSSQKFYRKKPSASKKIVLGHKSVDYGEFLDMKGISGVINRLYEDINIYDNTIQAFTMQFVSPVSDLAPTFYMYFIRDTIEENGVKLVELYFTPRNPEDLLFRGTLYITLDGNYAIRKAELGVSQHINLNYIREFKVALDFEKGPNDHYYLATSDMIALLSPWARAMGMVGERIVKVDQYHNLPLADVAFSGPEVDSIHQVDGRTD